VKCSISGGHVATGISELGAGLGLVQYNSDNFPPLVTTLQAKQDTFNQRRSGVSAAFLPWHGALGDLRKACLDARKLLSISLGR
jgi:hypothetical protein